MMALHAAEHCVALTCLVWLLDGFGVMAASEVAALKNQIRCDCCGPSWLNGRRRPGARLHPNMWEQKWHHEEDEASSSIETCTQKIGGLIAAFSLYA